MRVRELYFQCIVPMVTTNYKKNPHTWAHISFSCSISLNISLGPRSSSCIIIKQNTPISRARMKSVTIHIKYIHWCFLYVIEVTLIRHVAVTDECHFSCDHATEYIQYQHHFVYWLLIDFEVLFSWLSTRNRVSRQFKSFLTLVIQTQL